MAESVATTLLNVENLTVRFAVKRGGGFSKKHFLYAVDDVSFAIRRGETLAIVGESGSGKTTAALAVARLVDAYQGRVNLDGHDILNLQGEGLRKARTKVQFIFQDPYSSLNPRQRAEDIVCEPLDSLSNKQPAEKKAIVDRLFKAVGLRPEQQRLFPHQFSGGQRQRIGIARALATQPELIICDEPVSALDVAIQAQIINRLRQLQEEFGLTYLFISHDLGVMQYICDEIAVMYAGKVVEKASTPTLFSEMHHPYTEALLNSIPQTTKPKHTRLSAITGRPPDLIHPPTGCSFAPRCPYARAICREEEPVLRPGVGDDHTFACHHPVGSPAAKDAFEQNLAEGLPQTLVAAGKASATEDTPQDWAG